MPFPMPPVTVLTLPTGAGPTDPRIVLIGTSPEIDLYTGDAAETGPGRLKIVETGIPGDGGRRGVVTLAAPAYGAPGVATLTLTGATADLTDRGSVALGFPGLASGQVLVTQSQVALSAPIAGGASRSVTWNGTTLAVTGAVTLTGALTGPAGGITAAGDISGATLTTTGDIHSQNVTAVASVNAGTDLYAAGAVHAGTDFLGGSAAFTATGGAGVLRWDGATQTIPGNLLLPASAGGNTSRYIAGPGGAVQLIGFVANAADFGGGMTVGDNIYRTGGAWPNTARHVFTNAGSGITHILNSGGGIQLSLASSVATNALYASQTGAPPNFRGSDGDFCLRHDTPGVANQRLYVKSAGAWIGIA